MPCSVKNQTGTDMSALEGEINRFFPYAEKKLGFESPVVVYLVSDEENSNKIFGKTAHYNPSEQSVTLFVDKRHPKDILRSLSHELVHHMQNTRGEFDNLGEIGEGYAQNNEHLRKMESEAYLEGNLLFRDHEDLNIHKKQENKMNINESYLKKLIKTTLKEYINLDHLSEDDMPEVDDISSQMLDAEMAAAEAAARGDVNVPLDNLSLDEEDYMLEEDDEDEDQFAYMAGARPQAKIALQEQSKTDREDRVKGRVQNGDRRLDEDELEEDVVEEEVNEEDVVEEEKVNEEDIIEEEENEDEKALEEVNESKISDHQWYNNTLYERLVRKWTK